jgi:hypothetical protein
LVKRVNPESYFTRENNDFSDYIEDLEKSFYILLPIIMISYFEASHKGITEWDSKWQGAISFSEGRMLPSHHVLGQRSFAQTKRKITLYLKVECLEPH